MNGTRVPGKEELTCSECKRRGVGCGGVWKFHSQHGRYLLQCWTCRLKVRPCPFRRFEDSDQPKKDYETRSKKRKRSLSVISISDSSEDSEEDDHVAGPSSHTGKKVKCEDEWEQLKETLLEARKRRVEIETEAEVELAKVNSIIEEAKRNLKKAK